MLARNFKAVSPSQFNMPLLFWFFAKLYFGFSKPKVIILESEFAGEIEAIGADVDLFKKGDSVFGYRGQSMGAYAEYISIAQDACVTIKPTNLTYEEAAVLPYGTLMALSLLKKANLQAGQKILINGASGGIGSAAVQLAKSYFGAEVTGVCSTSRLDFVKSLGADHVIDYSKQDFTNSHKTYDLVFDILGKSTFSKCKKVLSQNGRYLLVSFKTKQLFQMLWTKVMGGQRVQCAFAAEGAQNLQFIKELIEAGKIKSTLDQAYPMEQSAEAHHYYEKGDRKGGVVITM